MFKNLANKFPAFFNNGVGLLENILNLPYRHYQVCISEKVLDCEGISGFSQL